MKIKVQIVFTFPSWSMLLKKNPVTPDIVVWATDNEAKRRLTVHPDGMDEPMSLGRR